MHAPVGRPAEFSIKPSVDGSLHQLAADVRTGPRGRCAARAGDGRRHPGLDVPQGGGTDADRRLAVGYEGLLSGGCLESDLAAHAESVLETGAPKMVRYDNGGDDDLLWGLGAGCEGGMDVWLVRLDPAADWEPFATLSRCFEQRVRARYAFVLDSAVPGLPVGSTLWVDGGPAPPARTPATADRLPGSACRWRRGPGHRGIVECGSPRVRLFLCSTALPRELLLIGGGPDALPVVEIRCHAGLARDRGGPSAGVRGPGSIPAGTARAADHSAATGSSTWTWRGSMPP